MILEIDDQTMDDLRIFSKREAAGIYDLYNNTHTRGGEMRLQAMFRAPLAEQEMINRRSALIKHFAQLGLAFPFEAAMFDMVEKYLTAAQESSDGSRQHLLNEKEVHNGVAALINLIQQVCTFIARREVQDIIPYSDEREAIDQLLLDPSLAPVLLEKHPDKLSYAAETAFDVLLRVRERKRIERLLEYIYQLDVYLSVAKVANKHQFVFPSALEKGSGELKLEGVYHPELKDPVANNLQMQLGHTVVFLTGANMAGKSTFLRSVGTAVYIAHMGFPVAARHMEFSVMDGIFTTINLPDNLGIGASHFYAEVLRVKQVAAALQRGKALFVIFDELFRGTNVKDAHEATVAITKAFSGKENSKFIISSHIVEAAGELGLHAAIGFRYLPTRMNGQTPEYTYTLQEGVTDDRHGMIIIRNEGILDILRNGRKRAHSPIENSQKTGNHELQH